MPSTSPNSRPIPSPSSRRSTRARRTPAEAEQAAAALRALQNRDQPGSGWDTDGQSPSDSEPDGPPASPERPQAQKARGKATRNRRTAAEIRLDKVETALTAQAKAAEQTQKQLQQLLDLQQAQQTGPKSVPHQEQSKPRGPRKPNNVDADETGDSDSTIKSLLSTDTWATNKLKLANDKSRKSGTATKEAKLMNFSRNLPNQRVAERDEEIIEKNDGSIERKTRSKANQIKTVDQWTVAACRFAVTDVPQSEYSEYFRYIEMVNQISVDHGVTAALHYDAVHRDRLLSGEVFGWQKDQFAFMEIMSFILANQRKADQPTNPRPGNPNNNHPNTCGWFNGNINKMTNKPGCPNGSNCKLLHKCRKCGHVDKTGAQLCPECAKKKVAGGPIGE